jgi:hypothetical protein
MREAWIRKLTAPALVFGYGPWLLALASYALALAVVRPQL